MITESQGFIKFDTVYQFEGFDVIGYFPYEVATIKESLNLPRSTFVYIEDIINLNTNKYILICRDKVKINTDDFCIYFKDVHCSVGKWDDVQIR